MRARFEAIGKRFGAHDALRDIELEIEDGECLVLLGPSGCGKTTLLRLMAGLETPDAGKIWIGDRVVNDVPPAGRDVAMVFQNYALYPHMTVYENLSFPLKLRKLSRRDIDDRVRRIARVLELEEQLPRKPGQLSGGQRQRVAMGRAMIREPYAYLMDEPLSNLDAKLRTQMRAEIGLLHKELGVTTIYVTHDQVEAMTLGERVEVLRGGELQQVAAPQELYNRPANLFVAGFIGSPAMNFFLGRVSEEPDRIWVSFGDGQRLEVDEHERSLAPALAGMDGKGLIVGVRPEHLQDAALVSGAPANRRLRGLVKLRELLGSEVVVHFEVQAAPDVTDAVLEIAEDVDESALSELDHRRQERRTHFVGRFGVDSPSKDGETAEIAVAAGALRFFDLESGARLAA